MISTSTTTVWLTRKDMRKRRGCVISPLGVPADLQSAVKKVRPIKTRGFVIPKQKGKHTPLLRIANPQSLNRLGHFLTPDYKSGGTPSGLAFLKKRRRSFEGILMSIYKTETVPI